MSQEIEIFRAELSYQKDCALKAYKLAIDNISSQDFWTYIQLFLVAAANISKCVYFCSKDSTRQLAVKRSERLRTAFSIPDSSPLKDRGLRNHFEHFDERIDDWVEKHPSGGLFVDRNSIRINVSTKEFRHMDPETMNISYGDEVYNINELYLAIVNLLLK